MTQHRNGHPETQVPHTTRGRTWLAVVLAGFAMLLMASYAVAPTGVNAQSGPPSLQLFVNVSGEVPNWQEVSLTVLRVDVGGIDATTRNRFLVRGFDGLQEVIVPRSAAGSARALVNAAAQVGRIDQVVVTLGASVVTTQTDGGKTSRVLPIVLKNNTLLLKPIRPLVLNAGDTASLVMPMTFGVNAVLARDGSLALSPTVSANTFVPQPQNFLNAGEIVVVGPTQQFPAIGVQIVRSKIVDPATGDIRDLTLRSDGAVVSFSDLRRQNEETWRGQHGALTPELVQQLASAPAATPVRVDIWVRVPGPQTFVTGATSPQDWDVAHANFIAARREAAEPVVSAVAAELKAAGATILSAELDPPVLHVQALPAVISSTAAQLGDAITITGTPTQINLLSTRAAKDLVQQPLFFAHLLGIGITLRIALSEDSACVYTEHPTFHGVAFEEPLNPCGSQGAGAHGGHSTAVAGALAGAPYLGGDPNGDETVPVVGLFSGRMFTATNCDYVSEGILARNPHLVNFSCTTGTVDTPGFVEYAGQESLDYAVYTHRVFVGKGAANLNTTQQTQSAMFPVQCASYNAVCVGGYTNNSTLGPGQFADDLPAERWANDPKSLREKPDLVGPNSAFLPNYQTTSSTSPYIQTGGTSIATPFVVGTAALLMANFQPKLVNDPTLTRAVLMASARHPFSGQPPVPTEGVDSKVGAGAPRGDRANEILKNDRYYSAFIDRTTDFDSGNYLTAFIADNAKAGDRVRVVMTYDQCQVDTNSFKDKILADLDMVVIGYGTQSNNSHVNNTEIVEFTANKLGSFQVKVKSQFWDACSDGTRKTHLAIAWDVLGAGEQ